MVMWLRNKQADVFDLVTALVRATTIDLRRITHTVRRGTIVAGAKTVRLSRKWTG